MSNVFTVIKCVTETQGNDHDLLERVEVLERSLELGDCVWMNPEQPQALNYRVVEVQEYKALNTAIDAEPPTVRIALVSLASEPVPPRALWEEPSQALYVKLRGGQFSHLEYGGGDVLTPRIGEREIDYRGTGEWREFQDGDETWKLQGHTKHPTDFFIDRFDTLHSETDSPMFEVVYIVYCVERVPVYY